VFLWTEADPKPGSPFATEFANGRDVEGRAGVRVSLDLDQAVRRATTERGWTFRAELAGYPPVWDVNESFNTANAVGSAYLPILGETAHLALRAGGAFASGAFPLQHAPAIGGQETLRGYNFQRYAGETSAFGSVELRVPVAVTVPLLVRWRLGVFGLADAGRVWFEQQSPGGWHTGVGGGIWLSSLGQTFSLAYAHGESNRVYLQKGMSF
jgi:hemolysin activation/secretion protein